jgi:hypothetical protein
MLLVPLRILSESHDYWKQAEEWVKTFPGTILGIKLRTFCAVP